MKYLLAGAIASLSLVMLLGENDAGEKAKYTIPEVMARAHKEGLMKKVASGTASDAEKEELVGHYVALNNNEPPKGDLKEWKKRTGAIVEAAKKALKGDEAAAKSLPKLANCAACHKLHKG
jgi:cytochrome c553